jgi:hypothetical protein
MLSWSDGHDTGADVDVVDGRCGNLPHRRRVGRGNASPLHGVGGGSAVDPRPASVGGTAPLCRGQAHARGWLWISVFVQPPCVGVRRCLTRRPRGPAIPRCADRPGTGEIMHVVDTRHGNLPRRWRGGRGNASPLHGVGGRSAADPRPASVGGTAPLCRGQAHARGWLWISVFVQPPCVGVRRCLTRRPRGLATPRCADRPGTGEIVHVVDARHGNLPRRWRGGRGGASPLHRWVGTSPVRPILATVGAYPPSCRGQALPDPPARRGGNPTPMAAAVPLPIAVQAVGIERPGLQPRAESPSPLKGAGRGAAGATNPPLGERHLDQPASAGLRIEPGRFHPTQSAPAWGSREGGRANDDGAAVLPTDPPCVMGADRYAARRSARWARRCLAPTRWADLPGRVPAGQGSAERPILSGGRRCLTPRPATAGKPDRGRSGYRGRVIHTGTFVGVHVATLPGAAPVDGSRASLAPRAHRPVPTASPCRLLTASPLGEPRRLSG